MSQPAGERPKSRFAWFGTFKGALALIATILGIVGASIGIVRSCQPGESTPSFEASALTREAARHLVTFVGDHDGDVVDLNISCGPPDETQDADSGCSGTLLPEHAPINPRADEAFATMEIFTERACPAPDAVSRCPGTYWLVFRVDATDDEQLGNGPFGAGGLVAKGRFKALDRGMTGATPPEVHTVELLATD